MRTADLQVLIASMRNIERLLSEKEARNDGV
jgi:hypothetical protein